MSTTTTPTEGFKKQAVLFTRRLTRRGLFGADQQMQYVLAVYGVDIRPR